MSKVSCAILIPHKETFDPFLVNCIKWIDKFKHPDIDQKIIIADDFSTNGDYEKTVETYGKRDDIIICRVPKDDIYANCGGAIDEGCKYIDTDYVCMTDADVFPISELWLWLPIYLCQHFSYLMVGCDSGLGKVTKDLGISPKDDIDFDVINNFYRIMRGKDAKWYSENYRFARRHPNDRPPGWITADNGVYVNFIMDKISPNKKYNIPLSSYVGLNTVEGAFGQIICGLIMHYALSSRIFSKTRADITPKRASEDYLDYYNRMCSDGLTEELMNEMLEKAKKNTFQPHPTIYPHNYINRVEELKAMYYKGELSLNG